MGYIRKWWSTPNGRVVEEYHSGRLPPPGGRESRRRATPEEMARANQRQKERNTQLLLMNNFSVNDYWITLTYRKEERPEDMQQCKKQFRRFIGAVRKEYRQQGEELKWIRNIEKGSRGGWHIHLVVNRIRDTDLIIRRAWTYGGVHHALMYQEGGFRKLAEYLSKTIRLKDHETGEDIRESSYSTSRNLARPPAHKQEMSGRTFEQRKIRIPAGFYLDKESLFEGVNRYTGYPYRYYTLLVLQDKRRKHADRTHIRGIRDG